jgi:hypothetical protein
MRKHIKNYATVKKKLKEYFALQYRKAKHDCEVYDRCFGNPKCLDKKSGRELYLIDEATTYMAPGHQIDADYVKWCHEYLENTLPKNEKLWTERLDAADMAGKLTEIKISVNWSRSRTGGSNPHAECWVFFEDAEYGTRCAYSAGRASGYGYDKRSAAVQEALEFGISRKRDNPDSRKNLALAKASFDRFVIEHGEDLWKEYAIDRTPMPHLDISGKGMSTFTHLFRRIGCRYNANFPVKGYLIDYSEPDHGSDMYHVIREDRI